MASTVDETSFLREQFKKPFEKLNGLQETLSLVRRFPCENNPNDPLGKQDCLKENRARTRRRISISLRHIQGAPKLLGSKIS